jgi:hypothetical protein
VFFPSLACCKRNIKKRVVSVHETLASRRETVREDIEDEVNGRYFTCLDRVHNVLFALVLNMDNMLKIDNFDHWHRAVNVLLVSYSLNASVLNMPPSVLEDRMTYPAFLNGQRKIYTDKSLLEYDRELRYSRQSWAVWGGSLDDVLRIGLVLRTTEREPRSKRSLEGGDSSKRAKKNKKEAGTKVGKTCNKISVGSKCDYGVKCKFNHVCPKCKKTEPHDWETCS